MDMKDIEKKVLSIIKEDGTKEEVELLVCFEFNDSKKEYVSMLEVALGASINNIITDDESCAKEAIDYLKKS